MEAKTNTEKLRELASAKMPFGKFKGRFLSEIPDTYLLWFRQKGFPKGKLGQSMQAVLEMKINGISYLLDKIREMDN